MAYGTSRKQTAWQRKSTHLKLAVTGLSEMHTAAHLSTRLHAAAATIAGYSRGPVELVNHFIFALNLKTAKAIGVTLPTSILLRADEVIE